MTSTVRLVLMRPRNAENLGSCARAMKNFGLTEWTWVAPHAKDDAASRRLAVHAGDLLKSARVVDTLDEAVEDCAWVVGTSSRRVPGKKSLTPRDFSMSAMERLSQGKIALVLGDERSGLTNAEVRRCHDLSTIPTSDEQPSVNLAQSVLVYAYELHVARLAARPFDPDAEPRSANDSDSKSLEGSLQELLHGTRFLHSDGRHALRDLVAPWLRARLTRKEVQLWTSVVRVVAKAVAGSASK